MVRCWPQRGAPPELASQIVRLAYSHIFPAGFGAAENALDNFTSYEVLTERRGKQSWRCSPSPGSSMVLIACSTS